MLSTPSFSPFANGIVERHNGILKQTMDKMENEYLSMKRESNTDNLILAHATYAKNATLTSGGYSAFMKAYGKDIHLTAGLESQHIRVTDEWVGKRVEQILSARKAVLEAENEMRIKHAMNRKADPVLEELAQGDKVQYYREMCAKEKCAWRGPAKVISINGKNITILHDNPIISAHHRDVRKIRNDSEFKWGAAPLIEKINKEMTTNDETNCKEPSLIKKNQKSLMKPKKTQCHFCHAWRACVNILVPRTTSKRSRKQLKSVASVISCLFLNRFVCSDCLQYSRNRAVIDFISGCDNFSFPQIMNDLRALFERADETDRDDYLITINANDVGFEFLQAA